VNPDPRPRWLSPEELETWRALNLLLARLPAALSSQLQGEAGLSYMEYYVLSSLSEQPDHMIRMSRLALMANAELSRLSHLMTRLEKRGLVRREPDPSDGRFTNAILTESGYTHLVGAAPGHVEEVRKLVFDVLDDDAQRAVRDAAGAIAHHLDHEGSSSP